MVDVLIGYIGVGDVIEHQEDTCEGQQQEQEKGDTTHTPGVGDLHGLAADFNRMQVQKYITHHDQGLVQGGIGIAVAKD